MATTTRTDSSTSERSMAASPKGENSPFLTKLWRNTKRLLDGFLLRDTLIYKSLVFLLLKEGKAFPSRRAMLTKECTTCLRIDSSDSLSNGFARNRLALAG